MGNLVVSRWFGFPVAILAGLALSTGCTPGHRSAAVPAPTASPAGEATAAPSASALVAAPGASAPADLSAAAEPALDLVQRVLPGGYDATPALSGYDWAAKSNGAQDDSLSGRHLLQIACSGSGEISATVRATGKPKVRRVVCDGPEVAVPFDGKLDVTFLGKPGNSGVVAWRVLSRT